MKTGATKEPRTVIGVMTAEQHSERTSPMMPPEDSATPVFSDVAEVRVYQVGDEVTLADGKTGTLGRIDGTMFLLVGDDGEETLQHVENIAS